MQQCDEIRVGNDLVQHLRQSGLPCSPVIRMAMLVSYTIAELATARITVVPVLPKTDRQTRASIRMQYLFDVAVQRVVETDKDAEGEVRDLNWHQVSEMMMLSRAVLAALGGAENALFVETVNSGPNEHTAKGIWTGLFRVTVAGGAVSC